MSDYGIWLSFNNQEEGFQIPVNPDSIEISEGGNGKTYDITGLGEINVIKNPSLSEVKFEGFFPATSDPNDPFIVSNVLLEPMQYVEYIQKWKATRRPIRLVFVGSTFDINIAASIESFDWREVGGAVGDIEYSLSLKKYIFYSAKKVKVETTKEGEVKAVQTSSTSRPNDKQVPKTVKLASGDNLWKIAQKHLGDGSRYKEIQKLNNITDAQAKKLKVGMEIKLPQGASK